MSHKWALPTRNEKEPNHPDEPWIRSIAGIVEMRCFHDRLHIRRIREVERNKLGGES